MLHVCEVYPWYGRIVNEVLPVLSFSEAESGGRLDPCNLLFRLLYECCTVLMVFEHRETEAPVIPADSGARSNEVVQDYTAVFNAVPEFCDCIRCPKSLVSGKIPD